MPSLVVEVQPVPADHTFYWFNECGVGRGDEAKAYCIEGTIAFDDLAVFDAAGGEIPTGRFLEDGVRHWDALYAHDARLSVDAQREAHERAPKWRAWATGAESALGAL